MELKLPVKGHEPTFIGAKPVVATERRNRDRDGIRGGGAEIIKSEFGAVGVGF